jgi:GT2 family glycosyltransferase
MPEPDISIVIVSYNTREYLRNCIDSILSQKDSIVEIIVVDNNSIDGTKELIKSNYPSVKLICNPGNMGFSTANNQGIKEASAALVALLNPDTELAEKNTLQQAENYLETNQGIAIVVPLLLNTDGSFQLSFWPFPGVKEWILELFYMHRMKKIKQPSSPISVQAASGAALIFRKSLINEIGGLDENMFWMEDVDFCYRASKAGKKIIWNPDIRIIHHGGKSSIGNESITIPNQVISRIKFSLKHDSKPEFYLINTLALFFILSRLFAFTMISFTDKKYGAKRKAYQLTLKAYFGFNFYKNSSILIK